MKWRINKAMICAMKSGECLFYDCWKRNKNSNIFIVTVKIDSIRLSPSHADLVELISKEGIITFLEIQS
jgi:hypothetical protein